MAARDVAAADIVLLIEQIGAQSRSMAEVVFTTVAEIFKHGIARRVVVTNRRLDEAAPMTKYQICLADDPDTKLDDIQ